MVDRSRDSRLTTIQWIAVGVGLVIGLSGAGEGSIASVLVRVPGYPVACAAIVRWIPIVRHRRWSWFLAHQAAMLAIVAGWAMADRATGVLVNGAWFVAAAAWFLVRPGRGQD